jgi:hypothetical protein
MGGAAAMASFSSQDHPDQDRHLNEKMGNLRTSALKEESHTRRQSIDSVRSVEAPTAPGPPAGPVAFDHPPTEEEKQQAKELMEKYAIRS